MYLFNDKKFIQQDAQPLQNKLKSFKMFVLISKTVSISYLIAFNSHSKPLSFRIQIYIEFTALMSNLYIDCVVPTGNINKRFHYIAIYHLSEKHDFCESK